MMFSLEVEEEEEEEEAPGGDEADDGSNTFTGILSAVDFSQKVGNFSCVECKTQMGCAQ